MMEKTEIKIIIEKCIKILEHIANDKAVPRNIRRNVNEVITTLQDTKKPMFMRISHCTSILENVSTDSNIPLHTRTLIWNAASQREQFEKSITLAANMLPRLGSGKRER